MQQAALQGAQIVEAVFHNRHVIQVAKASDIGIARSRRQHRALLHRIDDVGLRRTQRLHGDGDAVLRRRRPRDFPKEGRQLLKAPAERRIAVQTARRARAEHNRANARPAGTPHALLHKRPQRARVHAAARHPKRARQKTVRRLAAHAGSGQRFAKRIKSRIARLRHRRKSCFDVVGAAPRRDFDLIQTVKADANAKFHVRSSHAHTPNSAPCAFSHFFHASYSGIWLSTSRQNRGE